MVSGAEDEAKQAVLNSTVATFSATTLPFVVPTPRLCCRGEGYDLLVLAETGVAPLLSGRPSRAGRRGSSP